MPDIINPHLFRGYSIRGLAERDLPDPVVVRIGRAVGKYLVSRGVPDVLVGHDVRLSSPRVSRALVGGLLSAGAHVRDVGLVPTPVHNFATDFYGADAGIMVTASHNPPDENGLKLRTDHTWGLTELEEVRRLANGFSGSETAAAGVHRYPPLMGAYVQMEPVADYVRQMLIECCEVGPQKVVVDGGHSANGIVAPALLRRLGRVVWELHCVPDGSFPERSPDPTALGATDALADRVVANAADFGVAYDGDGDRLAVVDETGTRVSGDQLLMLLARDALAKQRAPVVYDVSCSRAVPEYIVAHGGRPVPAPTGYAFVHHAMRATKAAVGGEVSGHFFFSSPIFRFDDSILATLRLAGLLVRADRPLSALVASLPRYHVSPILRVECPDEIKFEVVADITAYYMRYWPTDTLDGARVDFGGSWALIRASNTQPLLSLRFESTDADRLASVEEEVMARVRRTIAALQRSRQRGAE